MSSTLSTLSTPLSTPRLGPDEIGAFKRDGYAVLRGAFGASDMARIAGWTDEIANWPERSGRHWVFHEKSRLDPARELIARIENIVSFHDGYRDLCAVLAAPVAQLMGENAVLFKEKVNFKMPGGDGFKAHQDSQAGWERYAAYFVTAVLSIDRATAENGCLRLAPGQHGRGLFRAWEPLSAADMAGMVFRDCPTEPGDLVLFDSHAPHESESNLGATVRRMYFATFNRAAEGDHMARYYADKHANYPPDIDRDPNRRYVFRV